MEGFLLNFQTQLGEASKLYMRTFLQHSFGVETGAAGSMAPPPRPGGKKSNAADWVLVKPFWLHSGPLPHQNWAEKDTKSGTTKFVLTKFVEDNIRNLTAAVAADVAPILLQGNYVIMRVLLKEYERNEI